eukprot:3082289-Amphidinium_carterae.1
MKARHSYSWYWRLPAGLADAVTPDEAAQQRSGPSPKLQINLGTHVKCRDNSTRPQDRTVQECLESLEHIDGAHRLRLRGHLPSLLRLKSPKLRWPLQSRCFSQLRKFEELCFRLLSDANWKLMNQSGLAGYA